MNATHIAQQYLVLEQSAQMPIRTLGRTGLQVTGFGLGGQALLEIEDRQKDAYDLIQKALRLGVTYFDTAAIYGPSRYYLGRALPTDRKNITIASKVRSRDYKGAKKELDESFKLLKTDYIDIIQLHGIENEKDKSALGKDGALRVLQEAKQAGKIGYVGLTGHSDPQILIEFMDAYDFDTLLVALNPAVPQFLKAIQKARSKNMGVIVMKVMARGILPMVYPSDKLLQYAMKYSDVAIVGCSNESDLERNVLASASYTGDDLQFSLDPDIIDKASFFINGHKPGKWPHTYQPDIPDVQH